MSDARQPVHEWMRSIASLVQAIAVAFGIWFGLGELRASQAEQAELLATHTRSIIDALTLPTVEESSTYIKDSAMSATAPDMKKFAKGTPPWRSQALQALTCIKVQQCDLGHIQEAFCRTAAMYARTVANMNADDVFFFWPDLDELRVGFMPYCVAYF